MLSYLHIKSRILVAALGVLAMLAAAPSLVNNVALAQVAAPANKILIDTDTRNYQCTTTTANLATSGLSVNVHKEGDVEWESGI